MVFILNTIFWVHFLFYTCVLLLPLSLCLSLLFHALSFSLYLSLLFSFCPQIHELLALCHGFLDNLWVSEDGARVVMLAVAFGSNKDRKTVLKALKDKVKELALTPPGAKVLQFCLDTIDDTVALRKQVKIGIALR
jgi:hypothetical protein